MFVVREVLHCKPGKVRQMVEKFKVISSVLTGMGHEPLRLLTDVTGEAFWTVVAEAKVETLDQVPERRAATHGQRRAAERHG